MTQVVCDGYVFDFTDAISAFKFDETDPAKPTFHRVHMKAVDIIAEFDDSYVFVELKEYDDPTVFNILTATTEDDKEEKQRTYKWLKNYLKYKYRDTFLYRYAENKVDKPIHYICLLNFDNALNGAFKKSLQAELPVGKKSNRWTYKIVNSCQVINMQKWSESFPKWTISPKP